MKRPLTLNWSHYNHWSIWLYLPKLKNIGQKNITTCALNPPHRSKGIMQALKTNSSVIGAYKIKDCNSETRINGQPLFQDSRYTCKKVTLNRVMSDMKQHSKNKIKFSEQNFQ